MAELTPLDEKLGEVLGLAQAAQISTKRVATMEGADEFKADLDAMTQQAKEVEEKTLALVDGIEGKKTAIREKARETKAEATDMMKTYLEDEEEVLDGFEFLSMVEAGELCHWEIVERIATKAAKSEVRELATTVLAVQREHVETVRQAYLSLAEEEAAEV